MGAEEPAPEGAAKPKPQKRRLPVARRLSFKDRAILVLEVTGIAVSLSAACFAGYAAWLTKQSTEQQLRAYVYPQSPDGLVQVGDGISVPLLFFMAFKNYGATPARELRSNAGVLVAPSDHTGPWPKKINDQVGMLVPQGATVDDALGLDRVNIDLPYIPFQKDHYLYLYGEITYMDIFGHWHYFEYCFVSTSEFTVDLKPRRWKQGDFARCGSNFQPGTSF